MPNFDFLLSSQDFTSFGKVAVPPQMPPLSGEVARSAGEVPNPSVSYADSSPNRGANPTAPSGHLP